MPNTKIVRSISLSIASVVSVPVLFLLSVFIFPSTTFAANPLVIYPYTISSGNPDATSATITWQTNLAGTSSLSYGPTTAYGTGAFSAISSTNHSLPLIGLTPNTTYHYELFSYDANGDIATSSDQTFTTVNSCNYYVDSVNGNDSNNGTDANTPYQHLLNIPTFVPNGTTICLKRGDTFKNDYLSIGLGGTGGPNGNGTVNNVTVEDYGPSYLPAPLIDNSNTIASTSWSLVSGTSNLYQATVTGPGTSYTDSASMYVNVFECKSAPCTPTGLGGHDTFLATENTQATASSTPGSYYIAGETTSGSSGPSNLTSFTIFMYPSDGTNPGTNGYAYSYSDMPIGVNVFGSNLTVNNIMVKKSTSNSGGFYDGLDGSNATFNNIESDQDAKHNILCGGGCTINNSRFIDEYYPSSGNMFVAFDQNGTGLPITLNNDTFIDGVTTANNSISAIYGHVAVAPGFSNLTVNGGLIEGVGVTSGWSGINMGDSVGTVKEFINGVTCFYTSGCIGGSATTTVSNSQDISPVSSGAKFLSESMAGAVTINSSLSCDDVGFNHNDVQTGTGQPLTVSSSTFYIFSAAGAETAINFGGVGSSLNLNNTLIDGGPSGGNYAIDDTTATSTAPYVGNNNTFVTSNFNVGEVNGTTYNSFASWKTATGQDANSGTTSPTPNAQTIACTPHQLSFTGPSSGNINATSSNFTVTPSVGYNSLGQIIGYVGTVTVTPSGTAAAGLSPITLTFPASASTTAQTFAINPAATGTITLSEFANGATTSPTFLASTTLTYQSNITVPGAPYGIPTATAGNTTATVSWNAPVSIGGSAVTGYTVTSSPGNVSSTTTGTSAILTGLTNGTPYTFTVTATNAAGTSASSTASNQVTPSTLPVLTTTAASGITTTSATINGAITVTGGSNATQSGFLYTTDPNFLVNIATSSLGTQTGTTTLSQTLSSLTCNTAYYFQSYATNISGTGYGTIQTLTTSACPVTTAPTAAYASGGGGQASAAQLASILAPGPATTAYLNSLNANTQPAVTNPNCPTGWICTPPPVTTGMTLNPFNGGVVSTTPTQFTQYLKIGSTGAEVAALQRYLNTNGYPVAASGPGSLGNETEKFGSLTKAALIKFQLAHNLPGTGYFGPMTMAVVEG